MISGLVIERSRVLVPAEAARDFSFPRSTFVLIPISVSVSPPVLPQQHVRDAAHSAESAGGRLQLKTHAPYLCGFESSDTVNWYTVVWCTQNAPRRQQFDVAPAMPVL